MEVHYVHVFHDSYGVSLAIWDHTVLPARLLPDTSEHTPP